MKLDLGCGPNKKEGFIGVDRIIFPGVDVVMDLTNGIEWGLRWQDNTIDEVHSSHFVEHLTAPERVLLMNQVYRVMKTGAKFMMIIPHWASCRAYGDPTHQWPPMSEFWFYYLKKEWRKVNAPHTDFEHTTTGFKCDFEATWSYTLHANVASRNQEYQIFAMQNYKEAAQDIVATLTKI